MGQASWIRQLPAPECASWLVKTLESTVLHEDRAVAHEVALQCEFYSVTKGAEIVHEGEESSDLFFIYEGVVTISRGGEDVVELGAGNFFGEMALLINDDKRYATVKAAIPSRFFVLRAPRRSALLKQNANVAGFLQKAAEARRDGYKG
jgi:CRP-like cAMP-binding protein